MGCYLNNCCHTYIHAHIRTYIHAHIRTYIHTCMYATHLGNSLALDVLHDLLWHPQALGGDIAKMDLVKGQQPSQRVDRTAMLKVTNHCHLNTQSFSGSTVPSLSVTEHNISHTKKTNNAYPPQIPEPHNVINVMQTCCVQWNPSILGTAENVLISEGKFCTQLYLAGSLDSVLIKEVSS